MRVLSLGAGVQSSTLLLMACEGEDHIDAAIFADTGWEPKAVYEWLTFLETKATAASIDFYRVTAGNIREDSLSRQGRKASLPAHLVNKNGGRGMLRRQCTQEYKIRPIQRRLRELGATAKTPAELVIGISLDEYQRMRTPAVRYVRHNYPLVDLRMTRSDCAAWLNNRGYPLPQKSACIGCPYHRNAEWRAMRDGRPEEWADAVAFDAAIRTLPRIEGRVFLHSSRVPLPDADLRSEQERGQLEFDMSDTLALLNPIASLDMSDGCGVLCASESPS